MSDERIDGRLRFVRALPLGGGAAGAAELLRRLDETPIAIVLGAGAAGSLAAQTTALTAVNLLARLFRRLIVVAPEAAVADGRLPFVAGALGPALVAFAARVHPDVRVALAAAAPAGAVTLHVADIAAPTGPGRVYCAGAGWLARVARQPVLSPAAADDHPVGPLVAAALGVAEVFKRVLGDALPGVTPAGDVTFSALTYDVGDAPAGPPLGDVRLPGTALVGAGSIGSAFLWGLAHLPGARGTLAIVDPDTLAPHNPDRAILVLDDSAARRLAKASWARDAVQPWLPGLAIAPFVGTVREYVDTLPPGYTALYKPS